MSKTTNYGLEKPEQDDYYDVDIFNNNADIVDEELAKEASDTQFGRTKLTNSSAVTNSDGLALPATEKNASIDGSLANQIAKLNTDLSIGLYSISYNKNLVDTNLFSDLSTVYITTYGKVAIVYGTLFAKAEINGAYPAFNTVAKGLTPNSQSFALSAIVENTDVDVYFAVDENLFFDIVASRGSIPAGSVIRVFGSFILK